MLAWSLNFYDIIHLMGLQVFSLLTLWLLFCLTFHSAATLSSNIIIMFPSYSFVICGKYDLLLKIKGLKINRTNIKYVKCSFSNKKNIDEIIQINENKIPIGMTCDLVIWVAWLKSTILINYENVLKLIGMMVWVISPGPLVQIIAMRLVSCWHSPCLSRHWDEFK